MSHHHCQRHYEELVADYCRTCNAPFCERCLVYSFGPKKPPYCIACALQAAGVRSTAGNPVHARQARPAKAAKTSARAASEPSTRRGLFRRRRAEPVVVEDPSWSESRVPSMAQLGAGLATPVVSDGQPI